MHSLDFIQQTLHDAAEIANRNLGKVSTSTTKTGDNNQVLTETDLAIGTLIVQKIQTAYPDYNIIDEEAGRVMTDFWGKPMDYSSPLTKAAQNFTVCAGAPKLHEQLQKIIQNY